MSSIASLQSEIEQRGRQIFALIDKFQGRASLFRRNDFYGRLMQWSMKDEAFKTQMFRFVDVLPTLTSSTDVVKHLTEYLKDSKTSASGLMRTALMLGRVAPAIPAAVIRSNVAAMANIFITGSDGKSALSNLQQIWKEGARFTVDILGEAVVSDREADEYATRYRALLDFLAEATRHWEPTTPLAATETPLVNLSVKISALSARVRSADPSESIDTILSRLRPIVARARQLSAFINLDMEHYGLKQLTIDLFKRLAEEFAGYDQLGLVMQAYLRDSLADTTDLLDWSRASGHRCTVRLVKGAYWDFEKVIAAQRTWKVPVYLAKPETDANYETITRLLLENQDIVYPAFASHNVRSIAHAMVYAEKLGLGQGDYEFQMLFGMATSFRRALVELGYRVREYCPIGELVPGMAYLVRRLLENTSNEGFLRAKFSANTSITKLLEDPAVAVAEEAKERLGPSFAQPCFINEPPLDFAREADRKQMSEAITRVHCQLGKHYSLVIGGKPAEAETSFNSINPARPEQIVGSVAAGGKAEVVAAVQAARNAFRRWAALSAEERARFVDRVADRFHQRRYELAAWQVFEVGKTWSEADADVIEAIDFCRFYAEEARRLGRGRLTQDVAGEVSQENYIARGVSAIIAPWNFPLAILCGMTIAALVTGNTVVIKPAEQSSIIGALFMEVLQEAGVPAGVANLLTGTGEDAGSYLVTHPDVDLIAFTGSREVGTMIWQLAGVTHPDQRNLKKVVCEMGGKNAMIVDTDADLDEAVPAIIQSAFGFQGQKCSALSRLIPVGNVSERLLLRLIDAAAALQIGFPEEPGTDIGPVIDESAKTKIESYLAIGSKEHRVAFQAKVPPNLSGYFVPPTIFTDVGVKARLAQEEIFGPVLAVTPAKDLDEAIIFANSTAFALTGGLYSRSPQNIEKVRALFSVGNLYINRGITGAIVGRHPFGGFLMSGGGTKAGGRDYLLQFTFPRVVTENTLRRGFAPETEALKTDGLPIQPLQSRTLPPDKIEALDQAPMFQPDSPEPRHK
jgi:RHH-type transcriptional regulator, proline utilization regulon repressor / proline dehydrogenase / delta 1-pyrroline-5-carboxylate dehydrogenase